MCPHPIYDCGMNFTDLNKKARDKGVSLMDAYLSAGLNERTYRRHARGYCRPQPHTFFLVAHAIKEMKEGRIWKDHWRNDLKNQFVRLRKERGITQNAVEDLLGVTDALVGKYEANMRTPNAFMLCCWADVLGGSLRLIPDELTPQVDALLEGFYAAPAA